MAAEQAAMWPEVGYLRWPYTAAAVAAVVCVQVALVAIWALLVSVLKNGRAKAVRFSTLDAICRVLDCQPGDVLRWEPTATRTTRVQNRARTHDAASRQPARTAARVATAAAVPRTSPSG
ncbi:helix-turn-helix domain-containing protein [Aquipuribacter sp. MA13-6]|uniref:helix-turn-helix domain-containing protein n=1 Tax=unclassified Aquipuribacter TaxID=2635084 RepID=UPI003EEE371F